MKRWLARFVAMLAVICLVAQVGAGSTSQGVASAVGSSDPAVASLLADLAASSCHSDGEEKGGSAGLGSHNCLDCLVCGAGVALARDPFAVSSITMKMPPAFVPRDERRGRLIYICPTSRGPPAFG